MHRAMINDRPRFKKKSVKAHKGRAAEHQKLPCCWCSCSDTSASPHAWSPPLSTVRQQERRGACCVWSPNWENKSSVGQGQDVATGKELESACASSSLQLKNLHHGITKAALSTVLPMIVYNQLFLQLFVFDFQAAVHGYLCQCHCKT